LCAAGLSLPADGTPLYGVWETAVTNTRAYTNRFDCREIELRARFVSPSARTTDFHGFHDGDGSGGQTGTVWKLRFMPQETGAWTCVHWWTDGTSGGTTGFDVADTGLPGPLRADTNSPWYLCTARGAPFHFRGYDLHHWLRNGDRWDSIADRTDEFTAAIQAHAIDPGYNIIMVDGAIHRDGVENSRDSWWLGGETNRFDVRVWGAWDRILQYAADRHLYVFPFAGMINQHRLYGFPDLDVFLKYWVARFGPRYNFLGWSPTWEWTVSDWTVDDITAIMNRVEQLNPFPTMLSVHDHSTPEFAGWMDFSMRQQPSRDVFNGNCRTCGRHDGVQPPFDRLPIVGAEDTWELQAGHFGMPRDAAEVRRAAWGLVLAGILPVYSEWTLWTKARGDMPGERGFIRLLDFVYSKTGYRRHHISNHLVSAMHGQVCSGSPGREYVVYDQDGGDITIDLTEAPALRVFDILWFDPASGGEHPGGTVMGGARRTLTPPFGGDAVLLLQESALPPDTLILLY
jgi:hypothetical protein